jgi:DNA invertase Pin-like site-specific DNA recombinase
MGAVSEPRAQLEGRRRSPRGRSPSIEAAQLRELKAKGFRATEIAKALGIRRMSVYRVPSPRRGSKFQNGRERGAFPLPSTLNGTFSTLSGW